MSLLSWSGYRFEVAQKPNSCRKDYGGGDARCLSWNLVLVDAAYRFLEATKIPRLKADYGDPSSAEWLQEGNGNARNATTYEETLRAWSTSSRACIMRGAYAVRRSRPACMSKISSARDKPLLRIVLQIGRRHVDLRLCKAAKPGRSWYASGSSCASSWVQQDHVIYTKGPSWS